MTGHATQVCVAAVLTVLLASAGALSAADAQQLDLASDAQPGTRMRLLTSSGARLTGTVRRSTRDTLFLASLSRGGRRLVERRVAADQVRSLWVSRGRSRAAGAKRGLWLGPLAGLALGALIGAGGPSDWYGGDMQPQGRADGAALVGGIGLVVGLPLGVAIGTAVGVERWQRRWPR